MNKAQEWKQKGAAAAQAEAGLLELPSGMVILARRPSPILLAMHNRLPMSLAVAAVPDEPGAASEADNSATLSLMNLYREILQYCVVSPAISLTPGPEEIHPRDVPNADVDYLFGWAIRGQEAASLESFRRQRSDGGAVRNGGDVRDQAQRADGDRGPDVSAEFRSGGSGSNSTA